MAEPALQGGCLCGAVRYRVEGPPLLSEYCHCGKCRRAGGAPVVVWADLPREKFVLLRGEPAQYASSPGVKRGFCAQCGSSLTFQNGENPPFLSVTVGTLDDPGKVAPMEHIFSADRLPWLEIGDDLPRHPGSAPQAGTG